MENFEARLWPATKTAQNCPPFHVQPRESCCLTPRTGACFFRWKPPNVLITPGGGLEPGESYEQAELREHFYETG